MQTGIKAGDVMKSSLVTLDEDATIYDASKLMKKKKVGSVLVYEKYSKKIYGIVTLTDIVHKAIANGKDAKTRLKAIASKPLIGVDPEADISDAAKLMGNEDLRRLVVFKKDRIIGILSDKDIIKISPSLYDLIAEKAEAHLE